MPEYLAPGVYVEETSFRAKSIEGVATSTAGFVGQARFGPTAGLPTLVTGYEEFQRLFGDGEDLLLAGVPVTNQLAHAVRLFFENGGKRVYVARVFTPAAASSVEGSRAASPAIAVLGSDRFLRARFPGRAGNVRVRVTATRSGNLLTGAAGARRVTGLRLGDVVEAGALKNANVSSGGADALTAANLYAVSFDAAGTPLLTNAGGTLDLEAAGLAAVQKITLDIDVEPNRDGSTGSRIEHIQRLSPHPDSDQFVGRILRHEDPAAGIEPPADRSQRIFLDPVAALPALPAERTSFARDLLVGLVAASPITLADGSDGVLVQGAGYTGGGSGASATGLAALAEIEDIAIVAAPGAATLAAPADQAVRDALISHCENLRYRFAILAGPREADSATIRQVRGQHDSKYAALYYPWLVASLPGSARETVLDRKSVV